MGTFTKHPHWQALGKAALGIGIPFAVLGGEALAIQMSGVISNSSKSNDSQDNTSDSSSNNGQSSSNGSSSNNGSNGQNNSNGSTSNNGGSSTVNTINNVLHDVGIGLAAAGGALILAAIIIPLAARDQYQPGSSIQWELEAAAPQMLMPPPEAPDTLSTAPDGGIADAQRTDADVVAPVATDAGAPAVLPVK